MAEKRKEIGLPAEMQEIKRFAKKIGIEYDENQKDKVVLSELLTRIAESVRPEAKEFCKSFKQIRWRIIEEAIKDRSNLIKWLYEEQGERRFDAANRLFLVL